MSSTALTYTQTIADINTTIHTWLPTEYLRTSIAGRLLHHAYVVVIVWPLQQVYLRGMWSSRPMADICAQLTKHRADFWQLHADECLLILENNFDSWLVWAHFACYILIWFVFARWCLRRLGCW